MILSCLIILHNFPGGQGFWNYTPIGGPGFLLPLWAFLFCQISCKNYFSGASPPRGESLLFRQKEPKQFLPVRVPAGASASAPNKMVREFALFKQPSPRGRFGTPSPLRPTL